MKLLLLACAVFVSHVAAQGTSCPTGYTFHSGKCLLYLDEFVTYNKAVEGCSNVGGSLAMIKSLEDDIAVHSFVNPGNSLYVIWLPLEDQDFDGFYFFPDGSTLKAYQPWRDPGITQGIGCVVVTEVTDLIWDRMSCTMFQARTVCEVQPIEPSPCDHGWAQNPDDNTCLRAIRGRKRTYDRAITYCKNLGGELAKNVFKLSQRRRITRLVKFRAHFFIGLDDTDNNGSYMYKDGSAMEGNPPFKKGTPPKGRCVTINKRRWFAKDCNKARFFVCEKDVATKTTT